MLREFSHSKKQVDGELGELPDFCQVLLLIVVFQEKANCTSYFQG